MKRTIILLTSNPTTAQAEGFAAEAARTHFDTDSFEFEVTKTLPPNLDDDAAAQLSHLSKETGPEAVYLVVRVK